MIYFTADWHLGNANIINYCNRPFADPDEMNRVIIDNMNSVVVPGDELIIVGDACMGKIATTLPLIADINCRVTLVPGNHDRIHPTYHLKPGQFERWVKEYKAVFYNLYPMQIRIDDTYDVCHFPYEGDSTMEERYPEYRPQDNGDFLIHGHVHDMWKLNGRQLNVGVDVWDFMPVSIDVIKEIANASSTVH